MTSLTVRDVLASAPQVALTERDLATLLRRQLAAIRSAPATQPDLDYLAQHGSATTRALARDYTDAAGRRASAQVAAATSVYDGTMTRSRTELAAELGVAPTTVSHRVRSGTLLAWRLAPKITRYPAWQVHEGKPLPHLDELIAGIPNGVHTREVTALMTAPDPDLGGATPAAWLAAGGDPEPVLRAVAGLGHT